MILMSLRYIALFGFAVMVAVASPRLFDSGDAIRDWEAFFAAIFFPAVMAGNVALAWCGYSFQYAVLIPIGFLLPVLYMTAFWIYFSG